MRHPTERGIAACALAALAMGLLVGCGESARTMGDPGPALAYVAYDSPDAVIANLERCWEGLDLAEYRDSVLYDGTNLCSDGRVHEPYGFWYDQSDDPELPDCDTYDLEIQRAAWLLSGLPSDSLPGVKSIDLSFTPFGDWEPAADCDDCPPDAVRREYLVEGVLTFKDATDDGELSMPFSSRGLMTCAAAAAGDGPHWFLFRWGDFAIPGSAQPTWGQMKALYPIPPKKL